MDPGSSHNHSHHSSRSSSMRKEMANSSRQPFGQLQLFVVDADPNNPVLGRKKRALAVSSWTPVSEVKSMLQRRLFVPCNQQVLFFKGRELKNSHSLEECGLVGSQATLQWALRTTCPSEMCMELKAPDSCPKELSRLFFQSKRGLLLGMAPQASMDGTGGTYFLPDCTGQHRTSFKPGDEEPFASHSSFGGHAEDGCMRKGVAPGTACLREALASLFDFKNFSGVPLTTLIECCHPKFRYNSGETPYPKLGSLQAFVPNAGVIEDYGCSMFSTHEAHKIAILDIRTLNCDRNAANILVSSDKKLLIPIDHGFCFPEVLEIGWCDWCWYDWPAAKEPFDEESVKFIRALDPEKDAQVLSKTSMLSQKAIKLVKWATILLKEGCEAGLTPFDIATLILRQDVDCEVPSPFENLIQALEDSPTDTPQIIAAAKSDGGFPIRVLNEQKEDVMIEQRILHGRVDVQLQPPLVPSTFESKVMADSAACHGSSPSSVSMFDQTGLQDLHKKKPTPNSAIQELVLSAQRASS